MLYLNHIDLATEEDKRYGLDYWADAFSATTWEELKTLAIKGEVFKEMAEAIYTVNADVSQRSIAEAHRKWLELNTYLTKSREKAEQQAAEAQQRAEEAQRQAEEAQRQADKAQQQAVEAEQRTEEAQQRADKAQQQADEAEQRADEAEQKLVKAEAELAKYKEKYGDDI